MKERAELVEWIRAEIVGPSRSDEPSIIEFSERTFADPTALRRGPVAWTCPDCSDPQEVLYYERESPHRKYGAGLLHPEWASSARPSVDDAANQSADTVGVDLDDAASDEGKEEEPRDTGADDQLNDASDDFEVTSPDVRHPTTMGMSFCAEFEVGGKLVVSVPQQRSFSWQEAGTTPIQLNGRYESCDRRWVNKEGREAESPAWRRLPATAPDAAVSFEAREFNSRRPIRKDLPVLPHSPIRLRIEMFPRRLEGRENAWIITVVMRNDTPMGTAAERESVLYQSFFQVSISAGRIRPYPESTRAFDQLDKDEQSLALLYRSATTWAIGHGCAACWDGEGHDAPPCVFADAMPVTELPSMTPNIDVDGKPISLSMAELSDLPDQPGGQAWSDLEALPDAYSKWMRGQRAEAAGLPPHFETVAHRHLDACEDCLSRIRRGIDLLKADAKVRTAFRLANRAILLQQIATKSIGKRPLIWDANAHLVVPKAPHISPSSRLGNTSGDGLGSWRAFQAAFLLMSLDDMRSPRIPCRDVVDLIWFPTGGGKTEAYLALAAFYMFHERLMEDPGELRRDGTNVLMRYTLRMLTTQQFQRAASLICAMEHLRRRSSICNIPGGRFSLGLWIGQQGSPNKIDGARNALGEFRRGTADGNPLVLTECPWCRAEIGRYSGPKPQSIKKANWNTLATCGVSDHKTEGPLLHCSDVQCEFGGEDPHTWLPIEVIDERIYAHPPSLVIATVDKLAMIAYRPEAGALFGRRMGGGVPHQFARPPGLIIQDELHLISGPLGSLYAIYEGIFERLCSIRDGDAWIKPKIIASTATIRGADEQVATLYGRATTALFPCPGLLMGDSFFGKYARSADGTLQPGRMYLGVHASDYGSVLTTQVRTFSTALFRPWRFAEDQRDPWWTLLAFYNSIRELGGAKTLFDSDIRSRLKFLFNREGYAQDDRRTLKIVEELTSRLTQGDIVKMMDRLSSRYSTKATGILDACLASNIIEVGVDIDRLSLMGVVGQPKTTSTYIQVTGRVGRRWMERPGLILVIYNPSKSRDRSHFEQFHGYHRRLYERVEPTTATPFAISAIQRALAGALLVWARQQSSSAVQHHSAYASAIEEGFEILSDRCSKVQIPEDEARSLAELRRMTDQLQLKWRLKPQEWEDFPPRVDVEYLMLWPGQFSTPLQRQRGVIVPSSMRQVDASAELTITQGYIAAQLAEAIQGQVPDVAGAAPTSDQGN